MDDETTEKEVVRLFDILGQAIYLTIKSAISPRDGGTSALRAQWRNVGKQLVKIAEED